MAKTKREIPCAPARAFGSAFVQQRTFRDGGLFLGALIKMRVEGLENLPSQGPFLLAANHRSYFDPALLTFAAGRWLDWVAMAELYRYRWFAWYLRALATIPLDRSTRDRAAVVAVLRHLRAGRPVGIFPEGGIRVGTDSVLAGALMDEGACRLAVAANVPLVPAVILGSERLYSPRAWLSSRRSAEVRVSFGPVLVPRSHEFSNNKEAAHELNARLVEALRRLSTAASG